MSDGFSEDNILKKYSASLDEICTLLKELESIALQLGLKWPCPTSYILQNIVRLQQNQASVQLAYTKAAKPCAMKSAKPQNSP